MKEKDRSCNCVRQCPCYPRCDEMMEEGQMPGSIPQGWRRQDWGMSRRNMGTGIPQQNMGQTMPRQDMGTAVLQRSMGTNGQEGVMPWQNVLGYPSQMQDFVAVEEENDRDLARLKEMYPDMAKMILAEVEAICDQMEYEGSAMFDSMPDKTRVMRMGDDIEGRIRAKLSETPQEDMQEEDYFAMGRDDGRHHRPEPNWMRDLIQVLLYQEMFHRRCRHRNCRRW